MNTQNQKPLITKDFLPAARSKFKPQEAIKNIAMLMRDLETFRREQQNHSDLIPLPVTMELNSVPPYGISFDVKLPCCGEQFTIWFIGLAVVFCDKCNADYQIVLSAEDMKRVEQQLEFLLYFAGAMDLLEMTNLPDNYFQ